VGTGESAPPYQGMSVRLSSDGSILAVGGPRYGTTSNVGYGPIGGAVWLYRYDGNIYQQVGDRVSIPRMYGSYHQGMTVSLSSDGTLLAVGGVFYDQMLAWVFSIDLDPHPR